MTREQALKLALSVLHDMRKGNQPYLGDELMPVIRELEAMHDEEKNK